MINLAKRTSLLLLGLIPGVLVYMEDVHRCKCSSSVILYRSIPLSVSHLSQAPSIQIMRTISRLCVCVWEREREREKERSGKARVPHLSCQTLPSLLTANSIKMKRTSWQHSNRLLHQSLSAVLWRSLREKYRNVWRNGSFSLSVSSSQSCAFSWFLELLWECGRSISLTFHHSPHLSLLLL